MPGRRDDDDDAAAATLLHHEAGDVLGAEEGARQVDADLAVPALERHLEHAQSTENPGVVHEHVDAAVCLARPRHHRLDLRLVGDVADDAERIPAAPHDRLRALQRVVGIDVHAHDARALVGQPLGDPPPMFGLVPVTTTTLPARRLIHAPAHRVASFERRLRRRNPARGRSRRGPSRPPPTSADGPAPGGRGGAGSR